MSTSRGWRASPAHGPCRERRTWRAYARGRHPGAHIPHLSRDERRGPKRLERRKRKEIAAYSGGPATGDALAFEGKGYEYPVRGSVEMLGAEVRFRSEGWLGIPETCLLTKD